MQNKIYEVIVLGASRAGYEVMHELYKTVDTSARPSIAFISRTFTCLDTYENLIIANIVYMDYFKGLIRLVSENNRETYFCKQLVLAVGTYPEKVNFDDGTVSYRLSKNLRPIAKNKNLVIMGNGQEAIKAAADLAKYYAHIYLCTNEFNLIGDPRTITRMKNNSNIEHLHNCTVTAYEKTDINNIHAVMLSTLEVLHAASLLAITPRIPDTAWLNTKMLSLTDKGKIIINANGQCTPVNTIYAIGECAEEPIGHFRLISTIVNNLKIGG